MKPIIAANSLSKVYTIGHQQQKVQDNLKDDLVRLARKPLELFTGQKLDKEKLWALKDVSFEIQKGEIVGVIGRNGSGKSTLLKILSRITDPTSGTAILRGRVASLLEVGTGFHPELTGRENIFLNGAILGMPRSEILQKFNQIIEFAGVEKFLDTPVKFYSSGMYVRLAFSVAAHLEPDILIVDEVLAVGDADFQKKSLGKMQDVTRSHDRTVLFVSHNLSAIQSICDRVIVLDQGRLTFEGRTRAGIKHYLGEAAETSGYIELEDNPTRDKLIFRSIELQDSSGKRRGEYEEGETIGVKIDYRVRQAGTGYQLVVDLWNEEAICIFASSDFDTKPRRKQAEVKAGDYRANFTLPTENLRDGQYYLTVSASLPGVETLDEVHHAISFRIEGGDADIKKLGGQGRPGALYKRIDWQIKKQ